MDKYDVWHYALLPSAVSAGCTPARTCTYCTTTAYAKLLAERDAAPPC